MIFKLALIVIFVIFTNREGSVQARKNVVCYHGTWATYRNGNGQFNVDQIDPFLCTHLMYAFFGIEESGELRIIDPYLDLEENYGRGNIIKFNHLKIQNPTLKTLAAVGGWNEGSKNFSIVAADAARRARFVQSTVNFLQKFSFDGIDLDWEYPNQRHNLRNDDRSNFVLLLKELKEGLEPFGYMLTAAVGSAEHSAALSYDIPAIVKYLDLINVMAYDLHGPWDNTTGLNAALYPPKENSNSLDKELNVEAIIKYWESNGAPKDKLVLGIPFYGRSFTLEDVKQHTPGSPHLGRGFAGQYSMEPGVIGYNELCEEFAKNKPWNLEWDSIQMAPYAYKDQQWVAYENLRSIELKAQFVKNNDLAGVMVWSIESDDFLGQCHNMKYPLLKLINRVFFGYDTPTDITRLPTKRSAFDNNLIHGNQIKTSLTPKDKFKCTTENGYVRDPKDCTKFYLCQDGITHSFVCPNSLFFDLKTFNCNYSSHVQCIIT